MARLRARLAKVPSCGVVAIACAGNNDLPAHWGTMASMPGTIGVGATHTAATGA